MPNTVYVLAIGILALALLFAVGLYFGRARWGHLWLNSLDGWNRLFCTYYHGLRHNHPGFDDAGPAVVVANHISGLDPLLLRASSDRPLRFMIAREEYERFGLKWIFKQVGCIPVDRDKRPERALREAIRALQAGEVVAIFPQGGFQLQPEQYGKLKGGAVRLARLADVPIYAMHIQGIHPKARGHVLPAVVIPSRARVHCYPSLRVEDSDKDCLDRIRTLILPDLTGVS